MLEFAIMLSVLLGALFLILCITTVFDKHAEGEITIVFLMLFIISSLCFMLSNTIRHNNIRRDILIKEVLDLKSSEYSHGYHLNVEAGLMTITDVADSVVYTIRK